MQFPVKMTILLLILQYNDSNYNICSKCRLIGKSVTLNIYSKVKVCVHLIAVLCGVSQPPGMNIRVKQKKQDEKGGRVNEGRGFGLVVMDEGGGGGGGSSVRCLSGLPGLTDGLFHVHVCLFLYVYASVCPIQTQPDTEG